MLNVLGDWHMRRRIKMTSIEMEKEIVKAIRIESKLPLASDVGYKDLIKFVKKLFKEYKNE